MLYDKLFLIKTYEHKSNKILFKYNGILLIIIYLKYLCEIYIYFYKK